MSHWYCEKTCHCENVCYCEKTWHCKKVWYCKEEWKKRAVACFVCALVVIFVIILFLILYFTVFKPKDPTVDVPAMKVLSCKVAGAPPNVTSVQNLILSLQISIYNPNRGDFYIEDGSVACLFYESAQVGAVTIPSDTIPSQSFNTIAVSVSLLNPIQLAPIQASYMLPITTAVTISGHVTNGNTFSHHSDVVSKCNVWVSLSPPTAYIQPYQCQKSYSLNN